MGAASIVGRAPSLADRRPMLYLQRDQPDGRAAARAHRRAHAARRARRRTTGTSATSSSTSGSPSGSAGRRVVDMACGEGYGSAVLARTARARSSASTPTPRPSSTRGCSYTAAERALRARPGRDAAPSRRRRRRVPADDRARRRTPTRCSSTSSALDRARRRRRSSRRPNVLTLAPEGAEKSGNPWHIKEYRAGGVPRAVRGALRRGRALRPVPRAQAARCTSSRSSSSAGTACTRRCASPSRSTTASRRRSRRATSRCAADRPLDGALDFLAVLPAVSRARRLALVLHTHMPYVEGFGTWPFGEEWLWEAVATLLPAAARRARRAPGPA